MLLMVIESVVAVPVSVIVKVLRPKTLAAPPVLSARPKPRVNAPAGPTIAVATTPDIAVLFAPLRFKVLAVALMFAGVNVVAV